MDKQLNYDLTSVSEKEWDKNYANFMQHHADQTSSILNNQLENVFIEGLKRKGFEFDNKFELTNFVKKHCKCLERLDLQERVYTVDEVPFLLHRYKVKIDLSPKMTERSITMEASLGSFSYL